MSGTIAMPPEAHEYVEAVRARLADLPAEDRDELLADVEISVQEAAAESGDTLVGRLGTPDAFAAELRAAAGFEPAATAAPSEPRPSVHEQLRTALAQMAAGPRAQRLRELAPIWWVARAYVAFAAFTIVSGAGFATSQPWLPVPFGGPGSLVVLAAVVLASVWLGLRPARGRALFAANALLAACAAWVVLYHVGNPQTSTVYIEVPVEGADLGAVGLNRGGEPVRNIYAYTRDGEMLFDVLLYDDLGRPIDIGAPEVPDALRRPVVDDKGRQLFNVFPIRHYDAGTTRVVNPRMAPQVEVPEIATPPLVREPRRGRR